MSQFKSFVSESQLEERRQKRQEEWDKVRKPEDPLEAPEEEYDPRSLYDRLQEQKDKKQAEYEESHKLKNMIRGLDDDEVEFLDLVDRTKEEIETQRWKEEIKEIREFRRAVADLAEQSADQRLQELKKAANNHLLTPATTKRTQTSLLATAVKRKSCDKAENSDKRPKIDTENIEEEKNARPGDAISVIKAKGEVNAEAHEGSVTDSNNSEVEANSTEPKADSLLKQYIVPQVACMGALPGLGVYSDSSDSENSSSSDMERPMQFDLLGRSRIQNNSDE